MATIRARWHRSLQVAPYQNELLELSAEVSADEINDGPAERQVADLFRRLAVEGDKLVTERILAHSGAGPPTTPMAGPREAFEADEFGA